MLRGGKNQEHESHLGTEVPYPACDCPFQVRPNSFGILFYQPKESFFLGYQFLKEMRLSGCELTLSFSEGDVIIEGQGLHTLFHALAEQKVFAIFEQGDRYETLCEHPVHVARIRRNAGEEANG